MTKLERTRKLSEGSVRNEFSDPQRIIACWCGEAPLTHTQLPLHTYTHIAPLIYTYTHTHTAPLIHTHTEELVTGTPILNTQELVTGTPILNTKYSGFLYTKSKYDRLLFFLSEQIAIFLSEGQKNP